MRTYEWSVKGAAADGQTWSVTGTTPVKPGDFPLVPSLAIEAAFASLTQGRAIYGKPGEGCNGPYTITRLCIELDMSAS